MLGDAGWFETVLSCLHDAANVFYQQILDADLFPPNFLFKILINRTSYHSFC